jgi:predicted nucleic acid-binding protein
MRDRFFLDTNVFAYSFDRNEPQKSLKASQLIYLGLSTHKGCISYQVIQEFLNVALRRSVDPMTALEGERYLSTVLQPLLAVHSSSALFSEGLRIKARWGYAWYDSLIVAAALRAQCEVLFTEDLQHGQHIGSLEIRNPFL